MIIGVLGVINQNMTGVKMAMHLDSEAPQSSLVSLQLDGFLYILDGEGAGLSKRKSSVSVNSDFDIAKSLTALVSQLVIHYSKPLLLPIKRGERKGMTSE
ncbi:hypothetical protein Tco_1303390 [Tanacetum coccineum]